jgi:O-methyltransferase
VRSRDGDLRSRARSWLHSHPRLRRRTAGLRHPVATAQRHVFTVRHLVAQYQTLGGKLELAHSDLFLHEMPQRKEFFRRAFHYLTFNSIDGDYAEFGCYGGMTFRIAWSACHNVGYGAHLWGFDSFEGLPDSEDARDHHVRWTPGWLATPLEEFHEICALGSIPRDRYTAVPGYYSVSLRPDAQGPRPEKISFAYIDCDLYSSTLEVLTFLETRLRPGSVLGFDDWFCYSPSRPSGERLAALEHFADSAWALVPFVQYGWYGMSFLVEDRGSVPPPVGPW